MDRRVLFDAVFFDLDGTLVATDRFWIGSASRAARRAFLELGLERALPTSAEWMSLVGKPLDQGFRELFPDLSPKQRRLVQAACVREEERALANGGAQAIPGARETLELLRAQGIKLGIASNCSRSYLEHMLDSLGLRALVDAALCLESSGIESKADMVARLLERFGTRSAVMVGDRAGDRDAAWRNGLPHVHCAFGFAPVDEPVVAEACIESLGELRACLEGRSAWIEELVTEIRAPARLAVTGGPSSGKTLLARDMARVLRASGRPAVAVSLEGFARTGGPSAWEHDPLASLYDLERVQAEVLGPHARGERLTLRRPGLDGETSVPPGAALVVEGPFLGDPRVRPGFERLFHLAIPAALRERRWLGRAAGPGSERETWLSLHVEHERRFPPAEYASLVVDASNALGPPAGPARLNVKDHPE